MTVIVALHERGETWIGADSRACQSNDIVAATVHKVAIHGRAALLGSGEGKSIYEMVRNARLLVRPNAEDTVEALTRFILKRSGSGLMAAQRDDDGGWSGWACSFLYANREGVWDIDSTLMPVRINDGRLWARGSGGGLARGAGHALRGIAATPKRRVEAALEAAIDGNAGCGGPVMVIKL